ncbi:MAG: hypothetical protein KGS72_25090, partial [Cyanobacteria bacterium REEB67]|nr:hypothetical protein [Cyanobacteria bacterium REEB67]
MPKSNLGYPAPAAGPGSASDTFWGTGRGKGKNAPSGAPAGGPSDDRAFTSPATSTSASGRVFTLGFCLLLIALFCLSLGVQLLHHFACDHPYVMFAFDGKHYLSTSQAMAGAFLLLFKGNVTGFFATIGGAAFGKNLIWDGPIIPGIPALFFALLGRVPQESDWSYFAIYFSVLASLSAVLLAVTARLLTGSMRAALTCSILAGLVFALYPTTLLATGVYRSEILGVTLMLAFLLALYKAPQNRAAAVAAGVLGGVFAMVKPVMIPAIGLLCLFAGLHARGIDRYGDPIRLAKIKLLSLLALAGVCTIASWSIYTAVDCGKLSITAERGPSYNAGVGTDLGADGWCTMPETEHVAVAKLNKSPAAVFLQEWKAHPFALAKLTMRRVTRLWGNPWNDFREPIFGLSMQMQVAIHLVLVAVGFMGLGLYLLFPPVLAADFKAPEYRGGNPRLLGNLAIIALLSHFSFTLFQTMGRYAYTSMPLLILFGAYGLAVMHAHVAASIERSRVGAKKSWLASSKVYGAAFCGLTCALLAINCDSFTHAGESVEVTHVLRTGEAAVRKVDLAAAPLKVSPAAALVLVDLGAQPDSAADLQIRLNGHELAGPLLPLNCFNGQTYFLFDTMAEHAGFMRASVKDFRQWRAVLVENRGWLVKDGPNEIEVINRGTSDLTLFGDRKGIQPLLLPSPNYFASDRMLVKLINNESRINILAPVLDESGNDRSLTRGTAGDARQLPDILRVRLAIVNAPVVAVGSTAPSPSTLAAPSSDPVDFASAPVVPEVQVALDAKKFHWFARTADGIHVNRAVLKGVGAVSCDTDLKPLAEMANKIRAGQAQAATQVAV